MVTEQLHILTIGIGAGYNCDGQVLVYQDMLGYTNGFTPKFAKKYTNLHDIMLNAFKEYKKEVEERTFPDDSHTFKIKDEVLEKLY
jgi:3-methyl-2-oxobutanoate hydroxymethyltransferase